MPRKKTPAEPSTGMADNEEPQNETKPRKPVAQKPSAKAKKPSPRSRQIIMVKIVSPNSIAKKSKTKATAKKNNGKESKAPKTPKHLRIKKMLTKHEKIAFADQVAQAQLVPGPAVLEEPVTVLEPPPVKEPKSKLVRQKVTKKPMQIKEEKTLENSNVAQAQLVPGPAVLEEPVTVLEPPPVKQTKSKLVRQKVTKKPKQLKEEKTLENSNVLQGAVDSASAEPSSSSGELWRQTNGSVKRKAATRKRLMRRKQSLLQAAQNNVRAEVVAMATPTENPTPAKRRGRSRKILPLDPGSGASSSQPPSLSILKSPARSTPDLSEAIKEDARKIEENLTRPESKISDTFSWAADISTSSCSTATSLVLFGGKLPTLELVDCIKYSDSSTKSSVASSNSNPSSPRKRKASPSPTKLTDTCPPLKRLKDKSESDKEHRRMKLLKELRHAEKPQEGTSCEERSAEERSRSAERRNKVLSDDIPKLERERLRVDGLLKDLESKWSTTASTSRKPQERNRDKKSKTALFPEGAEPSTSAKSPPRSKRTLRSDDRTKETGYPREPESTPDVTCSPLAPIPSTSSSISTSERLPLDGLMKDLESKWRTKVSPIHKPQKKRDKTSKPPLAPALSEPSTSTGTKDETPPCKLRLQIENKPKETNQCPTALSTPEARSSPSVALTSSTSISMSTSATTSNGSERDKLRREALDKLRRTLNSVDTEFLEWLSNEDDRDTNDPLPDLNMFRELKHEVEAIRIIQRFKRELPDLSCSEKSVENKSFGSDVQPSDPVCSQDPPQETAAEPMDIPDAPTDDKWPYESIDRSKKHFESQPDYCDDDVISLYAESFSGFDSVRNVRPSRVPSPYEDPPEPPAPPKPVVAPIENAAVVKTKTTDVRKQNADSSTYFDTSPSVVDSNKPVQTPIVMATQKKTKDHPILMADVYKNLTPSHLGSAVFHSVCFYNLISNCKKNACNYPHVIPEAIAIKNKLAQLSEQTFVTEYLLLRRNPLLRSRYMDLYVDECQKRDLTRYLVEMASDAVKEDANLRRYIMETTLLHLNDKDLETCKDILLNPIQGSGDTLCAVFMRTIAETQNFSRFKPVFVKLTQFLVKRQRKVAYAVASQIFERICILPYEETLAQAAIVLLKSTSPTIFENCLMGTFLDRLAVNNVAAYKDLMAYKPYQARFGMKALGTQPSVENVRYTSPDTTHLDGLQMKPPDETPRSEPGPRTFPPPTPLAPPAAHFENHSFGRPHTLHTQMKPPDETPRSEPGPRTFPPPTPLAPPAAHFENHSFGRPHTLHTQSKPEPLPLPGPFESAYGRAHVPWHRGLYRGSPRMPARGRSYHSRPAYRRGMMSRPFHWA